MAYKRQVSEQMAESYALKNDMAFFEVSPLCDFNVTESFAELSRVALKRNGMRRTWGTDKGLLFFLSQTWTFIFQFDFRINNGHAIIARKIVIHLWSSITLYRHTRIVIFKSRLNVSYYEISKYLATCLYKSHTATSFKIWNRISKNLLFCFFQCFHWRRLLVGA